METTNTALAKFEEFFAKLSPEEKANPDVQDMAKKLLEKKAQAEREVALSKLLTSVNAALGTTASNFKNFAVQYLKMVSPKKKKRAKPLSTEQVASVKKMLADGKSPADVAKAMGVKYAQVFKLKSKKVRSSTLRGK